MDPDSNSLSKEFEQVLMKQRIQKIDDIDGLKEIAMQLVDHNFAMKNTFAEMIKQGWLIGDKP